MVSYIRIIVNNISSIDICNMLNIKIIIINCYSLDIFEKLLSSFSVYSNAKKILSTRKTSETLTALNGIRFLSISWVVLGHTFAFVLSNISTYTWTIWDIINMFYIQAHKLIIIIGGRLPTWKYNIIIL